MATELYINDVKTGEDSFTREPMPSEVLGFPEHVAGMMIRGTAINLARTAFGEEFTDAVNALYTELTAKDQSS